MLVSHISQRVTYFNLYFLTKTPNIESGIAYFIDYLYSIIHLK